MILNLVSLFLCGMMPVTLIAGSAAPYAPLASSPIRHQGIMPGGGFGDWPHRNSHVEVPSIRMQLLGAVYAPDKDRTPPYSIYFAGNMVKNDDNGIFALPLDGQATLPTKLSLILSKRLIYTCSTTNTIAGFTVDTTSAYRCYDLIWDEKKNLWTIAVLTADTETLSSLVNDASACVMIQLDPQLVDNVANWQFPTPPTTRLLPKIILKNKPTLRAEGEQAGRARALSRTRNSLKSHNRSLDGLSIVHAPIASISKIAGDKTKVRAQLFVESAP